MHCGTALCAQALICRTMPSDGARHSPSRTGPFTFRMMKRSVSRNFTRTWVTCRTRDGNLMTQHAEPVQVLQ